MRRLVPKRKGKKREREKRKEKKRKEEKNEKTRGEREREFRFRFRYRGGIGGNRLSQRYQLHASTWIQVSRRARESASLSVENPNARRDDVRPSYIYHAASDSLGPRAYLLIRARGEKRPVALVECPLRAPLFSNGEKDR